MVTRITKKKLLIPKRASDKRDPTPMQGTTLLLITTTITISITILWNSLINPWKNKLNSNPTCTITKESKKKKHQQQQQESGCGRHSHFDLWQGPCPCARSFHVVGINQSSEHCFINRLLKKLRAGVTTKGLSEQTKLATLWLLSETIFQKIR